ncbi:hypothetical protein EBT31_18935, partial [bacterium]|nr:hypothetical protein [bacterium]
GKRKDLFAASLTKEELKSAKEQFGDRNSANFLPRMITFLDGVFTRDVVQEDFKNFGIQVPQALEKQTQDARNAWLQIRSQFESGRKPGLSPSKAARYKQLLDKKNAQ